MASSKERRRVLLVALYLRRRKNRRKRPKSIWIREVLLKRRQQGDYHNLVQEMRLGDPELHFRYMRMSRERFDSLLSKVGPLLKKRSYFSSERATITAAERLALTLRFLATGDSQISMSFNFRIGKSTVSGILQETCSALWTVLQPEYVKAPSTKEDWLSISQQFETLWNFPNCIGAIDGKHVVIQAPSNGGSYYYNYKGTHSVVLMAVVDALYRFSYVDVGDAGRQNDSGVFANCSFGQAIKSKENPLHIPDDRSLPGTTGPKLPYVIVADDGFPLRTNVLKPYPGRFLEREMSAFNYRLSRARRIAENAFGILASRWRIFRRPIIAKPDNVVIYTKAAIALHNYLRTVEGNRYLPPGSVDGEDGSGNVILGTWREEEAATGLHKVGTVGGNRSSRSAAEVRDSFARYFCSSAGEVNWQYHHIERTSYD